MAFLTWLWPEAVLSTRRPLFAAFPLQCLLHADFSLVTSLLWPIVSKPNQRLCVQNYIHLECKMFTAVVFIKLSFSFLPREFSSTCDVE